MTFETIALIQGLYNSNISIFLYQLRSILFNTKKLWVS